MTTGESIMPTAAYVGFVEMAADGELPDAGSLLAMVKSDPELPRPDRVLSLAAGVMAYFEYPSRMREGKHAEIGRASCRERV